MANVNNPFGLRPVRYLNGAPWNGQAREYFATGATGAIYIGDPVMLAGSANTSEVQGRAVGTLATVVPATAGDGNPILGVCVGVVPVDRSSTVYRATSTDRIILVVDDPNVVFQGQTDDAATDWAATDVGSYANLLTGTGSTVTGKSGFTLDTTDGPANNDPSNQLLVLGLSAPQATPTGDNAIGDFSVWDVIINNHAFAQAGDAGRATAA